MAAEMVAEIVTVDSKRRLAAAAGQDYIKVSMPVSITGLICQLCMCYTKPCCYDC